MAAESIQINVTTDAAAASAEIAELAEKLEALTGIAPTVTVTADAEAAAGDLEAVGETVEQVDGADAEVAVEADADDATSEVAAVGETVEEVDGTAATVGVDLEGADAAVSALDEVTAAAEETAAATQAVGEADLGGLGGAVKDALRPMGLAKAEVSDIAGAFTLLAEQATSSMGASEASVARLAGAIPYVGLAISAVSALWKRNQQAAEEAAKRAEGFADAMGKVNDALAEGDFEAAGEAFYEGFKDLPDLADDLGLSADNLFRAVRDGKVSAAELKSLGATDITWDALEKLPQLATDVAAAGEAAAGSEDDIAGLAGAFEEAATGAERAAAALEELRGKLSLEGAAIGVEEALDDLETAYADAAAAAGLSAEEQQDAQRGVDSAILDTKEALIDYLEQQEQIPAEKKTEILALIEQGKLNEAAAALDETAETRDADIEAQAKVKQAVADLQKVEKTKRVAVIGATAATAGAEAGLNFTARDRDTIIAAAQFGAAAAGAQIDSAARDRDTTIFVRAALVGASVGAVAGVAGAQATAPAAPGMRGAAVGPLYAPAPTVTVHVDARGAPDPYSVGRAIEQRLGAWRRVSAGWRPGRPLAAR